MYANEKYFKSSRARLESQSDRQLNPPKSKLKLKWILLFFSVVKTQQHETSLEYIGKKYWLATVPVWSDGIFPIRIFFNYHNIESISSSLFIINNYLSRNLFEFVGKDFALARLKKIKVHRKRDDQKLRVKDRANCWVSRESSFIIPRNGLSMCARNNILII